MAMLDFKEIPQANTGDGNQDAFELFAREFFSEVLHFEIISEPNRGADGGKDILAIEKQIGALSESEIRWLISCKHNAHSGKSVNETDEQNITDRLSQHKAQGFIGFYSTLPSSGLNNRLDSFKSNYKVEIFNHERIEGLLIKHKRNDLIARFFPNSYDKALKNKQKNEPSLIFDKYQPLLCEYCGKDLLKEHLHDNQAIINFITDMTTGEYVDVYACCKGQCDRALLNAKRPPNCADEWEDISDWVIPTIYSRHIMALLNQLYNGTEKYSKDTFEKLKHIILKLGQFVFRDLDDEQRRRLFSLSQIPDWC